MFGKARMPLTKKILLCVLVLLLIGGIWLWFSLGQPLSELVSATSPKTAARDYALQDDSRVVVPAPQPAPQQPYDPLKNLYWGELHVHTQESFDARLFGTTLTVEDAYRFAGGAPLRGDGGELMQLSWPLDFVAITDHAESFGLTTRCSEEGLSLGEKFNCHFLQTPNVAVFLAISEMAGAGEPTTTQSGEAGVYQPVPRNHPRYSDWPICAGDKEDPDRCLRDSDRDWARFKELADEYNQPGILTTFAGYEYSPTLPGSGKHHRNVIFNGSNLPQHATSSLDVGSAPALWRELERTCTVNCDFLTIPHNMNKAWGLFYSPYTWDGNIYTEEDWRLRQRREPLAEIYQVKGASECALGVGASDEECGFSQVLPPCRAGQVSGCAFQGAFARQGLKTGLALERQLGFNPLAFGFIAATDTHNANPGDAEEWDFVGKVATVTSPAVRRLTEWPDREPYESNLQFHTSGGLAAVWAEENSRDAIFSAMQRREAYATSGPRISLRFFAGWGFDNSVAGQPDAVEIAMAGGMPMGASLKPPEEDAGSPTFFAWARADLMSAPLQRMQVIKGWIDARGELQERVRDVACSDGLEVDPVSGRCPDNGAKVSTGNCELLGDTGAEEIAVAWQDPQFDPGENAFYYVRVIQNPTCRWSTYDAIRLDRQPPPHVPATIRERAWSSPIWINGRPGPG